VIFISGHTRGYPWCISDTDYAKHTWCLCVVSSVLSFICDHLKVLIETGAQARGLFLEVFVAMVSAAWLCICLNRLFLLYLLQRLCVICFYSAVFDTTAIFYDGKVFSTVNCEVSGNGGLYVHVALFDTFMFMCSYV
jgi:hypothetical protein